MAQCCNATVIEVHQRALLSVTSWCRLYLRAGSLFWFTSICPVKLLQYTVNTNQHFLVQIKSHFMFETRPLLWKICRKVLWKICWPKNCSYCFSFPNLMQNFQFSLCGAASCAVIVSIHPLTHTNDYSHKLSHHYVMLLCYVGTTHVETIRSPFVCLTKSWQVKLKILNLDVEWIYQCTDFHWSTHSLCFSHLLVVPSQ